MSNESVKERSFAGVEQLSLRSLVIGALGSCIITASSMYVALRMSALPWPTIFVAVLSMALLKLLGKTTNNEINVTQTSMSSGAMVSGGLAFTLPGLWITGIWSGDGLMAQNFWKVLFISISGMILGTMLTWILRKRFIETEALPYPIGQAAAETIVTGDKGGRKSYLLFGSMGITALFTYLRDSLKLIPASISSAFLYARNLYLGIAVFPMAVGIGYLIGTLYTGVWFLGSVLSYLVIIPLGTLTGIFPSAQEAVSFKNTAGIGLMIGTGLGILISMVVSFIKKISLTSRNNKNTAKDNKTFTFRRFIIYFVPAALAFVFSIASGLGLLPSLLLIIGTVFASAMAATITGQTGINPMEIFAIIVLLAVRAVVHVDPQGAFFLAACVAVACGYAGDMLNDYKTGHVLNTNPKAQFISQTVGGVVGTVVATLSMFAVINQFNGVGPEVGLPAAQAAAVSKMVGGIEKPVVFAVATIIGIVLYLLKVPSMTLGIGMYLSFEFSAVAFLGGLIRLLVDKLHPKSAENGSIISSGMLGGEGITGVTLAIIQMITGA